MHSHATNPLLHPLLLIAFTILLASCSSSDNSYRQEDKVIAGSLLSGGLPVVSSTVSVYSSSDGAAALGEGSTDDTGAFEFSYKEPADSSAVIYLTSKGGKIAAQAQDVPATFVLASVLGAEPQMSTITINELTTVASAFALAQFVDGPTLKGNSIGLEMAPRLLRNLVNMETGEAGATITNNANDPKSTFSALRTLNELGNLLASCATDAAVCRSILQLTLPLDGTVAQDTFRAMANLAKTPWLNPVPLFNLVTANVYQPDLGLNAPTAWTLSLLFNGDPTNLAGPGNMAFDQDGQMWIVNNLVTSETYVLPDCASQLLFRMDPATGEVDTFTGGGVLGAGYGVTVAPQTNDIWVGNYGFKGSTCPTDIANNSVSQFTADGMPLSPDAQTFDSIDNNPQDGGWTQGGIGWPQGTVANPQGDIWIASCNGQTIENEQVDVTIYRNGDPNNWQAISEDNFEKPFDIAFDTNDVAWVSGTLSGNIMAFASDGTRLREYDLGSSSLPMGVASDSLGNVWVSLSGEIDLPCPPPINKPPSTYAGIAMVNLDGVQINTRPDDPLVPNYTAPGGLTIAWGIAVDGSDNVWVANFTKGGVSQFCGAREGSCPVGVEPGDALSPDDTGYHSDLLDRNTAVEIDSSGNVWLTNNWKDLPIQTDPVGNAMVVYIGLASPVKAPLIGPPQRP
ncbi:Virginiamycin B lyase [Halioglobus japonicus]|nr:Virginiamycin B lyase [Halioglobus japonicus]